MLYSVCEWFNPALSCNTSILLTQSPANDVPLWCDSLARSSLRYVSAIVEPCGTNKDSRLVASVDHTSVPSEGKSGWCGGGGGGLMKRVIGEGVQMGFSLGM